VTEISDCKGGGWLDINKKKNPVKKKEETVSFVGETQRTKN
jgi:hypothetical protein